MEILLIYTLGRIPYSILRRKNKMFWITEFFFSIVFFFLSWLLLAEFRIEYSSIIISIVFVITGFLPRLIISGDDKYFKILSEKHKFKKQSILVDKIGIVDITFITLMGISLGLTIYINSEVVNILSIKEHGTIEYYTLMNQIITFWIDKIMISIMVLAGLVGAIITLLWSGKLWNKTDEKSKIFYEMDIITSIKILWSLIIISVTALCYLLFPLSMKLNKIINIM